MEPLEVRQLLSVSNGLDGLHFGFDREPNDTLDHSQNLTSLTRCQWFDIHGVIGNGAAGGADVDWYRFSLEQSATVTLTALDPNGIRPPACALSLYNDAPFDFGDPYARLGHRLLLQADKAFQPGPASIERLLAPGEYFVAVSGSGNRSFHPFLANSGSSSAPAAYELWISEDPAVTPTAAGPTALAADATLGQSRIQEPLILDGSVTGPAFDRSPLALHVSFCPVGDAAQDPSLALDPNSFTPDTVLLLPGLGSDPYDPATDAIPLSRVNFDPGSNELVVIPTRALAPGSYRLIVAGDYSSHDFVVADQNGDTLGADDSHPWGQDVVIPFAVTGTEGTGGAVVVANDCPRGSRDLGVLPKGQLVQISGAIGDDPNLPTAVNAAADVDLYHFRLTGSIPFAFIAEVSAGRMGSPLNPACSLFRWDATSQQMILMAANDDCLNPLRATNGKSVPLRGDAALFTGLTAGDYYLAVSSHGNLATPGAQRGPGVFNPITSHSGTAGTSTGPYLLSVLAQEDTTAPRVLFTSLAPGSQLAKSPTRLQVRFSEAMNLIDLAQQALDAPSAQSSRAIVIHGAAQDYYPRLIAYDRQTDTAEFLMLDGLPDGSYEFRLSGAAGLTDLAGNPLTGNRPSGDYGVSFTVSGSGRPASGRVEAVVDQVTADDTGVVQRVGVLFPHDLQAGITIRGTVELHAAAEPRFQGDAYSLEVLQPAHYVFLLDPAAVAAGLELTILDADGHPVETAPQGEGGGILAALDAGKYTLCIGLMHGTSSGIIPYVLHLALSGAGDGTITITAGPSPAIRLRLASAPPLVDAPPRIVVPGNNQNSNIQDPTSTGPVSLLVSLSSAPVGGITNPEAGENFGSSDRVVVRATPPSPLVQSALLLSILTPTSGVGAPSKETIDAGLPSLDLNPVQLAKVVTTATARAAQSWEQILDAVFILENWLDHLAGGVDHTDAEPSTPATGRKAQQGALSWPAVPSDGEPLKMSEPKWQEAGMLAAACVLAAGLPMRQRRARRTKPGIPRLTSVLQTLEDESGCS